MKKANEQIIHLHNKLQVFNTRIDGLSDAEEANSDCLNVQRASANDVAKELLGDTRLGLEIQRKKLGMITLMHTFWTISPFCYRTKEMNSNYSE